MCVCVCLCICSIHVCAYGRLVSVNGLLSWLRLIRYLEQMSPSTQQLMGTISASLADLTVVTSDILSLSLSRSLARALSLSRALAHGQHH